MARRLWRIQRNLWKSQDWLRFVRSLPCCCKLSSCPNCSGGVPERVEVHHIRYGAHVGLGRKPDDFLVLPLSPAMHSRVHLHEELTLVGQWQRLLEVWAIAERCGFLLVDPYGSYFPRAEQDPLALPRLFDDTAKHWRFAFQRGKLRLSDPSRVIPPAELEWGYV